LGWVMKGVIKDAKTICGILWLSQKIEPGRR
jgi:hypothetical protein